MVTQVTAGNTSDPVINTSDRLQGAYAKIANLIKG